MRDFGRGLQLAREFSTGGTVLYDRLDNRLDGQVGNQPIIVFMRSSIMSELPGK